MKIISKIIILFCILILLCVDLFTVIQVSKFYNKLSFESARFDLKIISLIKLVCFFLYIVLVTCVEADIPESDRT